MRAMWRGDDGADRVGHSGDVATMLDDMGIERMTACPDPWVVEFRKTEPDHAHGPMEFVRRRSHISEK